MSEKVLCCPYCHCELDLIRDYSRKIIGFKDDKVSDFQPMCNICHEDIHDMSEGVYLSKDEVDKAYKEYMGIEEKEENDGK